MRHCNLNYRQSYINNRNLSYNDNHNNNDGSHNTFYNNNYRYQIYNNNNNRVLPFQSQAPQQPENEQYRDQPPVRDNGEQSNHDNFQARNSTSDRHPVHQVNLLGNEGEPCQ